MWLKMGVPLKQIHVVAGPEVEAAIQRKISAKIFNGQMRGNFDH